jgi:hypothetical protein
VIEYIYIKYCKSYEVIYKEELKWEVGN